MLTVATGRKLTSENVAVKGAVTKTSTQRATENRLIMPLGTKKSKSWDGYEEEKRGKTFDTTVDQSFGNYNTLFL